MLRFEIFSPTGDFLDAFIKNDYEVELIDDYLSPTEFTVDVPVGTNVVGGAIVQVIDDTVSTGTGSQTRTHKYVFVVTGIEENFIATVISLITPLTWFDQDAFCFGGSQALSGYVTHFIEDNLIGGLMGYYPCVLNRTGARTEVYNLRKSQVMNGLDNLRNILKASNMYITYNTITSDHKVEFGFYTGYSNKFDIYTDNIISKTIIKDAELSPNVARLWVPSSASYSTCRSWGAAIVNGVIVESEDAVKSITNPVTVSKVFTSSPSAATRTQAFKEMLLTSNDNLQIIIQVSKDDELYNPKKSNYPLHIGDYCELHDVNAIYGTYLTAIRITGNIVEYTFGMARTSLTDKLIIKDRRLTND